MIDLRSDTVTAPCAEMRAAMAAAQVGDDVYGEDPTVTELEQTLARMLGKSAGLFVPSGTQSNLLALLSHCGRGDEYIVGQDAHTYRFEGGGAAALGGIQPQPLDCQPDGTLDLDRVAANIKPDDFHFAKTRLLCLENTTSGRALPMAYINSARTLCDRTGLQLHLDGARFFNAAIALNLDPQALAEPFHSVSVCLSKGLGAPVGSVLVGEPEFIKQARRWRKMVGGGMRQAGIIAAGGLYALAHNIPRLATDHQHAQRIADALSRKFGHQKVRQATNMVHLDIDGNVYQQLAQHLAESGIRVGRPRWVFHLDVTASDVEHIETRIATFTQS
ncbi:MAG: low-specificity L-threonine aldolase [bacterium]